VVIAAQRAAIIAGEAERRSAMLRPASSSSSATLQVSSRWSMRLMPPVGALRGISGRRGYRRHRRALRLIDADNTVRVALYTMEKQANGEWRISSCRIAPSTVRAASAALRFKA
jgi:hypothetical protein